MYTLKVSPPVTRSKLQAGSTMIEVLIAFIVFVVGLQGVLLLQYQAVKENLDSSQRSQSNWIAEELISRVRANPAGWQAGDYNFDSDDIGSSAPDPFCAAKHGLPADDCEADEMAVYDIWNAVWQYRREAGSLGVDFIDFNMTLDCGSDPCPEGSNFTLTMSWQSKAVTDNESQITDSDDELKTQVFEQVFRP